MAGYSDTYYQGLRLMQQNRRMQEAQLQQQWQRRMQQEEQQRKLVEDARRAQMQQAQQQRMEQQMGLQGAIGMGGLQMRQLEFQRQQQRDQEARQREEESRRRMELDRQRGVLRPGHRWSQADPTKMEFIPGSPEEQKMRAAHAADLAQLEAINNAAQGIVGRLGSITRPSNKFGFSQNFGAIPEVVTRFIPGKPLDTHNEIEQLKAMLKTSGLSDIRGRSGQSIGAITEREWPILAQQLANLDWSMTEGAAKNEIGVARKKLLAMRNKELREYENTYKGTPFYQASPLPFPKVEMEGKLKGIPKTFAHGAEVWGNLTPEEQALWMPGLEK